MRGLYISLMPHMGIDARFEWTDLMLENETSKNRHRCQRFMHATCSCTPHYLQPHQEPVIQSYSLWIRMGHKHKLVVICRRYAASNIIRDPFDRKNETILLRANLFQTSCIDIGCGCIVSTRSVKVSTRVLSIESYIYIYIYSISTLFQQCVTNPDVETLNKLWYNMLNTAFTWLTSVRLQWHLFCDMSWSLPTGLHDVIDSSSFLSERKQVCTYEGNFTHCIFGLKVQQSEWRL